MNARPLDIIQRVAAVGFELVADGETLRAVPVRRDTAMPKALTTDVRTWKAALLHLLTAPTWEEALFLACVGSPLDPDDLGEDLAEDRPALSLATQKPATTVGAAWRTNGIRNTPKTPPRTAEELKRSFVEDTDG